MHRVIYEDIIGSSARPPGGEIALCDSMPSYLQSALLRLHGSDARLTPIQRKAVEAGVFEHESPDMVVCAPTNSGKSLVGWSRALATILAGKARRSIFVTPLKAIAEEKRTELEVLCAAIHAAGGPCIRQVLSTGDYVSTGEFMDSPPPEHGEIIICTPERLDMVLRQEEGREWSKGVGSYTFDEFHLLGDGKRGPVMDRLLTHLLLNCPWSRITGLSATIGNPEDLRSWLAHTGREVVIVEDATRYPCLERRVITTDNKEDWLAGFVTQLTGEMKRNVLVFVATRARTRTVARRMEELLGAGSVAEFHAGLTTGERMKRVTGIVNRSLRAVVATTSLKMGVNLPVTDVVVLDGYLNADKGRRRLSVSDLAQMTGRAGRGTISGRGWVICTKADEDAFVELVSGRPENLTPTWLNESTSLGRKTDTHEDRPSPLCQAVLSELAARTMGTSSDIANHLSHAFAARDKAVSSAEVRRILAWMVERKLCFMQEGSFDSHHVTKIGRVSAAAGVSPETGALFAGFLRAMLKLGEANPLPDGRAKDYLSALSDLDLLFLVCASYELRSQTIKLVHKKQLMERTVAHIESMPIEEKPLVNRWRNAEDEAYPTRRLLASLRMPVDSAKADAAEQIYWALMGGAVLLHRHSNGTTTETLEFEGTVESGDFEGSWRPMTVWLLRFLAALCDPKRAYRMRSIRLKALSLSGKIAVGCSLGVLLRINGIGLQTILHLKNAGFYDLRSLGPCSMREFRDAGIAKRQSEILLRWLKRSRR